MRVEVYERVDGISAVYAFDLWGTQVYAKERKDAFYDSEDGGGIREPWYAAGKSFIEEIDR